MSDPADVTGVWYGRYVSRTDAQENSFIAVLEEANGTFTGVITEPDALSGGIRRANVAGRRDGAAVAFVKQYDGSGGWSHAVHYGGRIDGDGTAIAGGWKVEWVSGHFTMTREKFAAEELEDAGEVEIVAPGGGRAR